MDSSLSILLITLCIFLSAFFSAAETSFSSLNRIRIKNMADKGDAGARLVSRLLSRYGKLLSTVLIGNNLVNIGATAIATVLFIRAYGEDTGSGLATLVITLILLVFGEITPKTLASKRPEKMAIFAAPILHVLMVVCTPLTWLFSRWQNFVSGLIPDSPELSITEDELLTMVDTAENEGGINEQESTLIRNSIDFSDQEAKEIMTPRVDIEGIDRSSTKEDVSRRFAETGYSRLPVYEEDVDHIIGIIYQKDFFNKVFPSDSDISSIIRPVLFITEHKNIGELLRELQQKKLQIAVVLDEYCGTAGIVTMEDILEELVGEIWDEHDEIVQEIEKISDTEYIAMGNANLEKLFDEMGRPFDSEILTVNGWIYELCGHVPVTGETIESGDFRITVLEMNDNRVEKVRIEILSPLSKENRRDP